EDNHAKPNEPSSSSSSAAVNWSLIMDDSTIRAAIKLIETRIAVLSKEDPTNNERVIREFENLRQSILKGKEKEDVDENLRQSILKGEDVDMDDQDDDEDVEEEDEEEDPLDELEKQLEKRIVVGVILDLLAYEKHYKEHESAFTPDMIDNPPDDPMRLLSENDLVFIR
ncbi:hypothetical protein A2U01_0049790, partial [Trifolium medium]|nr:hypothetical protein [Trifolium medium]